MKARSSTQRHRRVAAFAWLLAGALLVAQALGVAHRVEHGGAGAASRALVLAAVDAHGSVDEAGPSDAPASTDPASLGSGSGSVHDCAAFDHATVGDAAPVPSAPAVATETLRVAAVRPPASPLLAAQASGYLARGPPAA